jgi:predicted nuclease of predicted toxin-antitoxin system
MRLIANENFSPGLIDALREAGHDVIAVRDAHRGWSDADILKLAAREERIVATFDKGFGALAFRLGAPAPLGIILVRLDPKRTQIAPQVVTALNCPCPWEGHIATIEPGRIRVRALPET